MADRDRFAELVLPHFDVLYRAAFRLTRSRPDAEDLVQDVCVRAFDRIDELDEVTDRRAWLMRIQYRLFIDVRRRWLRSPVQPADGSHDAIDAASAEQPEIPDAVDGIAAQASLGRAWSRLAAGQRALLALHAEGYDLAELAAITGLSRGVLSARLYRARSRLARALSSEPEFSLPVNGQEG